MNNFIYFYGERNKFGQFSNFYPCELVVDPKEINLHIFLSSVNTEDLKIKVSNSEQAIMYLKAILMQDLETASLIKLEPVPFKCKVLGRKVKNFNQELWDSWREEITVYVLRQKFESSSELKTFLLSTGSSTLVEASPRDKIWGIGISVKDAIAGREWKGQNLLGQYLMKVREIIK